MFGLSWAGKLFVSALLKFLASLDDSIFQSVNTIRGNNLFSVQYRRLDDRGRIFFVDRYSPKLFVVILAGIFLSIVDGFLTLLLMNHGAYEINPIMAYLLKVSPSAFVASKYALTCLAALIVLMLRDVVIVRRRKLPTHVLLYFFVGAFAAVVAWELYLISIVAT